MNPNPVAKFKLGAAGRLSAGGPVTSRTQSLPDGPNEKFAEVSSDSSISEIGLQPAESFALLYCGGFLHRKARSEADDVLAACFRVLRPLGTLRIATLDLDRIVHTYLFNWTDDDAGVSRTGKMNAAFQQRDLQYIFGEEELTTALTRAGFVEIQRLRAGASSHQRFWNLELDPAQALILEAKKPRRLGD